MNINHLAIFYAVYLEGSVSLGADRLCISQPAVSKQLREFEEQLHTRLFDRHPKGVAPTESGRQLAEYAHKIFALESEAELALSELRGLKRGKLVVGASLTIGNYLLPEKLAEFHRLYPGIEVNLEIANTEMVQKNLVEGSLDIGMTEGYAASEDFQAVVFSEDELVPIAAPDHPLALQEAVTLSRLCREDFVLREHGSGSREVIERAMAARGCEIHAVMTMSDIEAIKRAVAAGIGIGIVSVHSIALELQLGKLRRINVTDMNICRPLHLLTNKNRYQTHAARALVPLLMEKKQTQPISF
jgi:DNA-binding transcriptional LysR family regulator